MASIYLHIPFCDKKCIYCDFYSLESVNNFAPFLNALENEIIISAENYNSEDIETIFFGGGTPSLLKSTDFERILNLLHKKFKISNTAEITTEANPGTVDLEKLKSYRSIGLNRISFGVQSFIESELKFLSRIHSVDEIFKAVLNARKAGFDNLNLDLIFALPNQTFENWKFNLESAIKLNPEHISSYSLIVEPNTPLKNLVDSKIVSPLPQDLEAEFYSETINILDKSGFKQYEISNFSKSGFECKHNLNYWNHSNYIGFGPSAHSFWKNNSEQKRFWNYRNLDKYISLLQNNILPIAGSENLDLNQLFIESVFLGLRKGELNLSLINSIYKKDLTITQKNKLEDFLKDNLIEQDGDKIYLTKKGFSFSDEIATELIS